MRKYLLRILIGLVAVFLIAVPLLAGGIHFSASFSLGSLIAKGDVAGLGTQDVLVVLTASGIPQVVCKNQGGNIAPGQKAPRVSAEGSQLLPGNDPLRKNGKAPFNTEASVDTSVPLPGPSTQYGCPNDGWTAYYSGFVFWDTAEIKVTDDPFTTILASQNYSCVTTAATKKTPASVSCTPVP